MAEKTKRPAKVVVVPSAETNKIVREKCSRVSVDVKKVAEHFGCGYRNALILAAAAENDLVPAKR